MPTSRLRYASYHLHLVSLLAHRHSAKLTFRDQVALVQALDSALDLLESEPSFRALTILDGCGTLEDYLRLRPEHFERLEAVGRRGALQINPFYVLPELSVHTPEGVIRNLLRGTASAKVFGGAMPVALCLKTRHLPDWLPQVLRGFGIQAILADWYDEHPLEQNWQGDDGSQVLLTAVYPLMALEIAIENVFHRMASCCQSGHLLLFHLWSAQTAASWRMWLTRLKQQRPIDILLHSTPSAYLRAVQAARNQDYVARQGNLALADLPSEAPDAFAQFERFLTQTVEPLIAFAALQASPRVPVQPQRLIAQLWQPLFDWTGQPFSEDARQALEAQLSALKTDLAFLAERNGADLNLPQFERLVRSDDVRFALTTCKLPDDPSRSGMIVRGRLSASESAWITLTPFRRFAHCEVISMAEVPTGGNLTVEEDGAIIFRAEPQHLYTFWLHD
ncbi:MAG: hypothetical protein NZ571_02825 [Anaerolineae bacterium]|nr:hypothetical protein [Anaerolineae bacterium]